jgi:hypothetical protein
MLPNCCLPISIHYIFIGHNLSYLCPLWVTIGHLIINVDEIIHG